MFIGHHRADEAMIAVLESRRFAEGLQHHSGFKLLEKVANFFSR